MNQDIDNQMKYLFIDDIADEEGIIMASLYEYS